MNINNLLNEYAHKILPGHISFYYMFSVYFEIKELCIEEVIFNHYNVGKLLPRLLKYPKIIAKCNKLLDEKRKYVNDCTEYVRYPGAEKGHWHLPNWDVTKIRDDIIFIDAVVPILGISLEKNEITTIKRYLRIQ